MPQADRNAEHLYGPFKDAYTDALEDLNVFLMKHYPAWSAELGEGFRSTERQVMLYAQGRTSPGRIVTYKNGTTNKSNHQSSMAADVWYKHNGKITFEDPPKEILDYYGHCLRAHGLDWGGDWHNPDYPHAEWKTSDRGSYDAAHAFQLKKGLR